MSRLKDCIDRWRGWKRFEAPWLGQEAKQKVLDDLRQEIQARFNSQ